MSKEEMDCYFYVDMDVPESERRMSAMHVGCRNTNKPNEGWFYRGSVEGYGPFEYRCKICNGIIHEAEQDDKENSPSS
jgi:hypothetical protein